jgi:hypothetical protein
MINSERLLWWLQQGPSTRAVFHDPKAMIISAAVEDLCCWINPHDQQDNCEVWMQNHIQISLLESLYERVGVVQPYSSDSYRVLRSLWSLTNNALELAQTKYFNHAMYEAIAVAANVELAKSYLE